jgi:TLD
LIGTQLKAGQGAEWWAAVQQWTHEPSFSFTALRELSYDVHEPHSRRPLRRVTLEGHIAVARADSKLQLTEEHVTNDVSTNASTNTSGNNSNSQQQQQQQQQQQLNNEEEEEHWAPVQIVSEQSKQQQQQQQQAQAQLLLAPVVHRSVLTQWLPLRLRHKKLRLVFSTELHGSSLSALYRQCSGRGASQPCVLVIETGSGAMLGAYCSDSWQQCARAYGSGECFLFTLLPEPAVYRWAKPTAKPTAAKLPQQQEQQQQQQFSNSNSNSGKAATGTSGTSSPSSGGGSSSSSVNTDAAAAAAAASTAFMIATEHFIALGSNPATATCAIKLQDGLSHGSSSTSVTYSNAHSLVQHSSSRITGAVAAVDFSISCVEVYTFQ